MRRNFPPEADKSNDPCVALIVFRRASWKFRIVLLMLAWTASVRADTALMIGHVAPDSARLWYYSDEYPATSAIFASGGVIITGRLIKADEKKVWIDVRGLRPGFNVTAEVLAEGATAVATQFKTPELPASTGRLTVAFGSCNQLADPERHTKLFRVIALQNPDFVLWLGDNWYYRSENGGFSGQDKKTGKPLRGDWSDPAKALHRALSTRLHPDLRALLKSAPNYAIWDDHDFGYNNAPFGDPPVLTKDEQASIWFGRDESMRIFSSMWANPRRASTDTPGIFCSFRRGPAAVFLMDDRYDKDVAAHRIWGPEQTAWLKKGLLDAEHDGATIKIIANGTQVLIPGDPECHEAEAVEERVQLMDWIETNRIGGVVFLSGDRHRSELWTFGENDGSFQSVECTASPFFQDYRREPGPADKARLWVGPKKYNFGLLTIDAISRSSATLHFEARDDSGGVLRNIGGSGPKTCESTFSLHNGRFSR